MTDQPDPARAERDRLLKCLRVHGADYEDLRRRYADWLDLHLTDANALSEIATHDRLGPPLTAAGLSSRLRLSLPATSALLNRLEQAGHIRRGREHKDKRVVTLHASDHAKSLAEEYWGNVGSHLRTLLGGYPPEQRRLIDQFLKDLHQSLSSILSAPGPGLPSPGSAPPSDPAA